MDRENPGMYDVAIQIPSSAGEIREAEKVFVANIVESLRGATEFFNKHAVEIMDIAALLPDDEED